MRLKLFEEYGNKSYWAVNLPKDDLDKVSFEKKYYDRLLKWYTDQSNLGMGFDFIRLINRDFVLLKPSEKPIINIYQLNDYYFFVHLYHNYWFICDDFEGLIECLEDKI